MKNMDAGVDLRFQKDGGGVITKTFTYMAKKSDNW